jgi:formate dehydrogenase iron-sulfur subunit
VVELDLDDGKAHKCTLCYDRLKGGLEPACAKACPTNSIQFGRLEELHDRARHRVQALRSAGADGAYLYGVENADGSRGTTGGIGDLHAFFLLTDRPEAYNLPSAPSLPSTRVKPGLVRGLATMAGVALAAAAIFWRESAHG